MEQRMVGTWRTYKTFHFNGKVQNHNTAVFIELSVDEDNVLTIFHAQAKRQATVLKPGEWSIEAVKKRRYFYFGKKQAFELITLEREDLVLADIIKGEKLFFAKMPGWHQRIEPFITSTRHIHPEKKPDRPR